MSIMAISPIDGRYASKTSSLNSYFSEFALIKFRVRVEVEYFLKLTEQPIRALEGFPKDSFDILRDIYLNFSEEDAEKVKRFERITNHDVKAVEYFIKEKFEALGLSRYSEFIHFGLTSQDINNTSVPMSIKECFDNEWNVLFDEILAELERMSVLWKDIPMLARTHGQPASPTRLGKEIYVFVERLKTQKKNLENIPVCGKFGGATGNFNAHHVAFPEIDWVTFSNDFLKNRLFPKTRLFLVFEK